MLNRIILIGRLATDPELKYTPSGIAVTQFRLAVDRPMSAEARQKRRDAEVVADNLKSLDKPKEGTENGGSYSGGASRSDYSGGGGSRYEDEPAQVAPAPAAAPRTAAPAPVPSRRPAAAAAPAGRYQPSDEDLDDPFADS
jgi:single-strand DNA-binding protein